MSVVAASNGLRLLKLGAVAMFAAGASGCATTVLAVGASAAAVAISDKTAGDAIDDAAASAEIKARMFDGKGFNLSDVHVAMSEGFVLLAGTTPTPQDRIEAERRAWTVSAVRNVANELVVGPSRTIKESLQDKMIGTQVRSKFIGSQVKGLNFTIETHKGQVYLLGIARTNAELGDAVNEARTVGGVRKVVSYVRVDKRPDILRPETPAQAAAVRAQQLGLASPAGPQQTYGEPTAPGAQPDYAPYEKPQRADYGQTQYSQQPAYAQQSYSRQNYAVQSQAQPSQTTPYDYNSPSSSGGDAVDLGPASEGDGVVSRPPVPDSAPLPAPQAPASYSPPAARFAPSAGSGPVMLTPP